MWLTEAAKALPQIGESANEVRRVTHEHLGAMGNLTRATVTKHFSLFSGPDRNWTPRSFDYRGGQIVGSMDLSITWGKRQKARQRMQAIAAKHPHWTRGKNQPHRNGRRVSRHVASIITRNRGWGEANIYRPAIPDEARPSFGAGANHAPTLQKYFGEHLYGADARWVGYKFRHALGWLWHPNMPNYPTCVCRLGQRKLDFQHVCPKCGGRGFTVTSPALGDGPGSGMPVNCKVFIQFLHDRGIDTEFRYCREHKKSFDGGQSCPVCHSQGIVTKARGLLEGWTQPAVGKVLGQSASTIRKWEKICKRGNMMRTIHGRVWRLCSRCHLNYSGSRCKCGFSGGKIVEREPHKYLWLISRTLDSDVATGERERLQTELRRNKRWLDAPVYESLKQAVELSLKVLGEWSGGEHQLQSLYNEMRRRLAHSGSLSCFANVLFPVDTS